MKFQPGQSGNPAGRPPGSRNKKSLEMEELLAQRAEATVTNILDRAGRGEPAAMRLCMEWIAPTGANSPANSDTAPAADPLYSPVNSANEAAGPESSDAAARTETAGESLYSPVNSADEAAGAAGAATAGVTEARRGVKPDRPRTHVRRRESMV